MYVCMHVCMHISIYACIYIHKYGAGVPIICAAVARAVACHVR